MDESIKAAEKVMARMATTLEAMVAAAQKNNEYQDDPEMQEAVEAAKRGLLEFRAWMEREEDDHAV